MRKITIIAIIALAIAGTSCESRSSKNKSQKSVEMRVKTRPLGNTGIQVGEIGIGCGAFGKLTEDESRELMDVAIENGINYIDIYDANPVVRGNIGYAIRDRRDKMVIQGHIGSYWNGTAYERTLDVEKTKTGLKDLLKLLETDYLEVGMIHICDKPEDWNTLLDSDFLKFVKQLKEEGTIKHIGMSTHNAEVALMAAKSGFIEVIMFSLNPAFDRLKPGTNAWDPKSYDNMLAGIDPVRVELYDYCAQHNIAITAMKVFGGGGKLLNKEASPLKVELTPVQCISYALSKPCVATAICGAGNVEELHSDLEYCEATEEQKDYSSALKDATAKCITTRECTYCNHCSPCPVGIDIAKVNALLDEASKYERVPENLVSEYKSLSHKASECIECGACETRCPFEVPVRERMKKAAEIFEK